MKQSFFDILVRVLKFQPDEEGVQTVADLYPKSLFKFLIIFSYQRSTKILACALFVREREKNLFLRRKKSLNRTARFLAANFSRLFSEWRRKDKKVLAKISDENWCVRASFSHREKELDQTKIESKQKSFFSFLLSWGPPGSDVFTTFLPII